MMLIVVVTDLTLDVQIIHVVFFGIFCIFKTNGLCSCCLAKGLGISTSPNCVQKKERQKVKKKIQKHRLQR